MTDRQFEATCIYVYNQAVKGAEKLQRAKESEERFERERSKRNRSKQDS